MKIVIHIGPMQAGAETVHDILRRAGAALAADGALLPDAPGPHHHGLVMAALDPAHVDPLRAAHGQAHPAAQSRARDEMLARLRQNIADAKPRKLLLVAPHLAGTLRYPSEVARLCRMLRPLGSEISLIMQLEAPARMLARHYGWQVMMGRRAPLGRDLALAADPAAWRAARDAPSPHDAARRDFDEIQQPPFWIDVAGLRALWEGAFGAGSLTAVAADAEALAGAGAGRAVAALMGLGTDLPAPPARPVRQPLPAAWLARARAMNVLLTQVVDGGAFHVPAPLWLDILRDLAVAGPSIPPGSLHAAGAAFADGVTAEIELAARGAEDPAAARRLADALRPPDDTGAWREADPLFGYRASQYLLAVWHRIEKANRLPPVNPALPAEAQAQYATLAGSGLAPDNRHGTADLTEPGPAFAPNPAATHEDARAHALAGPRAAIIACMKNEAPYILEWLAHHRAIGFTDFVIYTNDCSDGTDHLLDRLATLGIVHHRRNDDWRGNSPQQHALNTARADPVVRAADWVAHIDVDEFINIRTGNGCLDALLARMPPGTSHIAMTWRLFGHNGVVGLRDAPVIAQFERCAPSYCPKPHVAWGFKTLQNGLDAYARLGGHRPNKPLPEMSDRIRWANGSGVDVTEALARRGWRSSRKTVGYDLVQLNHYALRSAEGFLIKRQRGRALHVDRGIGLNYWLRMDWNDTTDLSIQRNLPRMLAERDRLMADPQVARLHRDAVAWHVARAAALRARPDFAALLDRATALRLTAVERAAYATALDDMES
ncbi:MAG: glycosyltransferase family 2 protein [Rhodobacteraceae bacterium]|nr:glycosyltransferase family 2 protein [Paracoccaceae bacterium]